MKRLWQDYSLLWVMLIVCVVTSGLESVLTYSEMERTYRWHGDTLTMKDFWLGFIRQFSGRVAASVLVLIIFTVARAFYIYKGSPVSKDGPDERTALLKAIRDDVAGLRRPRDM
jgi:hypothetical protein